MKRRYWERDRCLADLDMTSVRWHHKSSYELSHQWPRFVLLATSSVGTTDAHPPWHTMSAAVVIASVSAPDESLLSACPLSSWHTRAPPAASA